MAAVRRADSLPRALSANATPAAGNLRTAASSPAQALDRLPSALLLQAVAAAASAATSAVAGAVIARAASLAATPRLRASGPQGACEPFTLIDDGTGAWIGATFAGREAEYSLVLSDADLAEVSAAVAHLEASGTPLEALTATAAPALFPLPGLGPKLAALGGDVMAGRGFAAVRGLFRAAGLDTDARRVAAFMGLSAHAGFNPGPQRKDGKLLHHVKAINKLRGPGDKEYNYGESTLPTPLTFHADGQCDAVALLCLQQAPGGGESAWVCAAAVHNELLRRGHARAVEVLMARGVWFRNRARYQDVPAGEEPWWEMPVFDFTGGSFACHVAGHQYEECFDKYGRALGAMSDEQRWAYGLFISVAEELALRATLAPGDVQFLDNTRVLHARSSFVDGDAPHEKRHLARLWGLYPRLPALRGALPAYLSYPRDYAGYDPATAPRQLLRPDPAAFFVPTAAEDPRA